MIHAGLRKTRMMPTLVPAPGAGLDRLESREGKMASELEFAEFVADQMEDAGKITFRKMFGEYGVYCDGKIIALICDNKLFIKPTEGGRKFIGSVTEAPAYPGSKMYYFIEDKFEDRDWISGLARITAKELPEPKPKSMAKPKAEKKVVTPVRKSVH